MITGRKLLSAFFIGTACLYMGCTHIAVASFDKTKDTVTIQGGKWATQEDYQKKADEYCGHPAALVSMGQKQVGSYTQANVQSYGNSASGQATTVGITRYLYTFFCK